MNIPYVQPRKIKFLNHKRSLNEYKKVQKESLNWHIQSGSRNHMNFTNMSLFCEEFINNTEQIDILDYGGGGGQFALVALSIFTNVKVLIVDMYNERLLERFKPINNQIKFGDLKKQTKI